MSEQLAEGQCWTCGAVHPPTAPHRPGEVHRLTAALTTANQQIEELRGQLDQEQRSQDLNRITLEQVPRIQRAAMDALERIADLEAMLMAVGWPAHRMSLVHPDLPENLREQIGWLQELFDELGAAEAKIEELTRERDQAIEHLREAVKRLDSPHSKERFVDDLAAGHMRQTQRADAAEAQRDTLREREAKLRKIAEDRRYSDEFLGNVTRSLLTTPPAKPSE